MVQQAITNSLPTGIYSPKNLLKNKVKLPKIVVPGPDISKRNLAELAAGRKFTFKLLPKTHEWLSVEVTDGKGQVNIIEIYDALGAEKTCTCDQYFEEGSGYCVHLAALEGIDKFGWNSDDATIHFFKMALGRARISIPISPKLYKEGAVFWDSLNESQKIVGRTPNITENWVAFTRWKNSKAQNNTTGNQVAPKTFYSLGLLNNNLNLFPYQEDVFNKMLNAKRAICSMVMGSGKTITTIACFAWLNAQKPTKMLVIAPKSLCLQWQSEIKRATGLSSVLVDKEDKIKAMANSNGPFITTYQYATRHTDEFKKHNIDVVVVDEIQFVKNNDTKTWKALSQIKSEYFYGLSGTVIENRLDDLYSIMQIVNPSCLGPKWKFNHRFQNVLIHTSSKVIYTGVKNLDQLKTDLESNVFFYNNLSLPHISHIRVETTMNSMQKSWHDQNYDEAKFLIAKSLNQTLTFGEKMMLQAFLLKARQSAQTEELITKNQTNNLSNKMKEFEKLLKQICITNQEKVVVFSEWTEHLKIAKRVTDALNLKSVFFTGEESAKQRDSNVQLFKNDSSIQVFFSSDAGGVGLDGLQLVANNVIHLELPWNPSRLDQRTGRVHRFLQTKPVTAYYLICKDSIEEKIELLLQDKRDTRTLTLSQFL